MRKHIYSISIASGLIVGAIMAMFKGFSSSTFLTCLFTACLTGKLISLDWSRAKSVSNLVAEKIGGIDFALNIAIILLDITCFAVQTARFICRPFYRILYLFPSRLLCDANFRKITLAVAVINILSVGCIYSGVRAMIVIFAVGDNFTAQILGTALLVVIPVFHSFIWLMELPPALFALNYDLSKFIRSMGFKCLDLLQQDGRGALASVTYLFWISLGNVIKLSIYPLIVIPALLLCLANHKTWASVTSIAALFSVLFWSCHFFNWTTWGNFNFYLALGLCLLIGSWLGQLIHRWSPKKVTWPSLGLREYLPKATC